MADTVSCQSDTAAGIMTLTPELPMAAVTLRSESGLTQWSPDNNIIASNNASFQNSGHLPMQDKISATGFQSSQRSSHIMPHQDEVQSDSTNASSIEPSQPESEAYLQLDDWPDLVEYRLLHPQTTQRFRLPFALVDVYQEWHSLSTEKRRALVQEIRDALPSSLQTQHLLHEVYIKHLHSIHGHVVHCPTVRSVLNDLLTSPHLEHRQHFALDEVATALMVIFSALCFLDRNFDRANPQDTRSPVESLKKEQIRQKQKKLYTLVKRIQRFERSRIFSSISQLQTAVLMLAYGTESPSFLDSLADCAIRSAVKMGIHRLGSFEKLHSPKANPVQVVTGEMAVRCWWGLVRHDWSQSDKHLIYRIASSQFNTRQPLDLSDQDLLTNPCPRSHLRLERTHLKYSYATIDCAIMTRILVDKITSQSGGDEGPDLASDWSLASTLGTKLSPAERDSLDRQFQSFITNLPACYSIDAGYDVADSIEVERVLLHLRLFQLFLMLHMPLTSESSRPHASLVYMANRILDIPNKVTDIFTQIDTCYHITLQAMRACLVLLLDLFHTDMRVNVGSLSRLMTRRKISVVLEKFHSDNSSNETQRCVQLLQLLMTCEDHRTRSQIGCGGPDLGETQETSESNSTNAAFLRRQWHATCQMLDVLFHDGHWRSLGPNAVELDPLSSSGLQELRPEEHVGYELQASTEPDVPSQGTLPLLLQGCHASRLPHNSALLRGQKGLSMEAVLRLPTAPFVSMIHRVLVARSCRKIQAGRPRWSKRFLTFHKQAKNC